MTPGIKNPWIELTDALKKGPVLVKVTTIDGGLIMGSVHGYSEGWVLVQREEETLAMWLNMDTIVTWQVVVRR